MLVALVILAIVACVLLILVVLVQNPKGGGLSSTFGGMSNQVMGVQRTTDFLEKSTWTLMGAVALIALFSVFFVSAPTEATADKPKSAFEGTELTTPMPSAPPVQQRAQQQTQQNATNPLGDGQQAAPATDPNTQPQQTPPAQ